MCGRYTYTYTCAELYEILSFTSAPIEFVSNYNVAPSQSAPIVREINGERRVDMLRWGLVPHWAKDKSIGFKLINARADTVASKPSFRDAFKSRRCLVPASGFYEWLKVEGEKKKQPFYFSPTNVEPFFFAGLWERWETKDAEGIESFTIITTDANEIVSKVHNRMPVILKRTDFDVWLDPKSSVKDLEMLLVPYSSDLMKAFPVSVQMNSPAYNSAVCIAPLPTNS